MAALSAAMPACDSRRPALLDGPSLLSARRAAVLPLTDAPGNPTEVAGSGPVVADVVLNELLRLGKYEISNLTAEKLEEAAGKAGYAVADGYDPVVAAAFGRELGVDVVVIGEVTHYGAQQEQYQTSVSYYSGGETKTFQWVGLNVRIVRAADGKTIYAGSGAASSNKEYSAAAKDAAAKALAALKDFLQRGK